MTPAPDPKTSAHSNVAVIGAGIIGLSIAWRLAQHGAHVTVFERGASAREASYAGAGMLAPGGEVEHASPFGRLLVEARELYPAFVHELEQESGTTIDLQQGGALDLAYTADEWDSLQARARVQQSLGIPSKPLSVAHVKAFWPRVRVDGLVGALFYPRDALVNPRDLLTALQIACASRNVALHEHTPITAIRVEPHSLICEFEATAQAFDTVVVAAGAWSGSIPVQGVPPLPATEPIKGHLVAYQQPLETCTTIIRCGSIYIVQRANGLLIVGASVEHQGFDRTLDPAIIEALAHAGGQILEHLNETTPTDAWTGLRPGSADLQIGPWHDPRLLLAYGHFRNGILLAPTTAQQITELFKSAL